MIDFLKHAVEIIATVTDAYFKTDLPEETWFYFVDVCTETLDLAWDYVLFIMSFFS